MALLNYMNRVHLGPGTLRELAGELAAHGIARPFVVTDPGMSSSEALRRTLAQCPAEAILFSQTPQNPTEEAVEAASDIYRARGCDGLVALGGGSPIDLAKAVAVLATHGGELGRYTVVQGGDALIRSDAAPLIAIPTTAGTGSETGRAAMITLRNGRKRSVRSDHLVPKVAICDAELTASQPRWLAAATGMDALTHCIETFLSPVDNPIAETIALRGAALAYRHIEAACAAGGGDLASRHQMMTAALMGGLAFQKGMGAVHGLAHQLGALKEPQLHHGTLNAVLLPAVLRFNQECAQDRFAMLGHAFGLASNMELPEAIEALNVRLGLPARLRELGVTHDSLDDLAEAATCDPSTRTNVRPIDVAGYRRILADAF